MEKKKSTLLKVLLLMAVCLLGGCSETENKKEIVHEETGDEKYDNSGQKNTVMGTEEKDTIIWTIPDLVELDALEKNIVLINERLSEDGYSFSVSIKTLPYDTYREDLIELLASGGTDIASLGTDMSGSGWSIDAEDLVREGYFEELTDYLASESGKRLKQEYCEDEWKTVETDGKIYSIPNQTGIKGNGYWAFNRKYVTEEMIQDFSGSIQELGSLLEQIAIPEGVYPILGGYSIEELAQMSGYEYMHGVFFDLETGVAVNPYLNEELRSNLTELHSLCMKGYFGKNGATVFMDEKKELEEVKSKNFLVWKNYSYGDFYEEIKDGLLVVPSVFSIPSTLSISTGISANSINKEAALQFLTLVYTEEVYANLLLYGKEGEDYQLVDGYVCDMQGNEIQAFLRNLMFGVYDHALPCSGDDLITDRDGAKKKLYTSKYKLASAVLGFQADRTYFDDQMLELYKTTEKYLNIWQEDDFESAWATASRAFEENGGQKVVDELNKQIQVWMEGQ